MSRVDAREGLRGGRAHRAGGGAAAEGVQRNAQAQEGGSQGEAGWSGGKGHEQSAAQTFSPFAPSALTAPARVCCITPVHTATELIVLHPPSPAIAPASVRSQLIARSLPSVETEGMRELFLDMDADGSGTISAAELREALARKSGGRRSLGLSDDELDSLMKAGAKASGM